VSRDGGHAPVAHAYADAVRALAERGRFGVRLGLGRTRALLRALGDPQRQIRGALVAGTNGKGSVIALASAALRDAGVRVGETPKPHLVSYRERIVVDGRPIAPDAFATLVARVLGVTDQVARRHGDPTEFELLTAAIFLHFAEVGIDVALVEVGLGGRLDATHAWDGGVAVVTNVGLDHTDRLGTTIEAIAREKAAIIERGDRAVTGADGAALAIIRRRARRLSVPLTVTPPPPVLRLDRDGLEVDLPSLGATRIGLRGRHQGANASVADGLLDALETAGIAAAASDARRRGYAAARWPGRLELITVPARTGEVDVLLDGAHNPAGAATLGVALDDLRPHLRPAPPAPLTVVWAAMADKDVPGTLAALARCQALRWARVICTQVPVARALPAGVLADVWRSAAGPSGIVADAIEDVDRALEEALESSRGPVVVAGSLYLVGEARRRLVHDPELVDPVAA